MLIEYFTYYLIFVIVFSILISLVIFRFKFPSPHIIIPIIIAVVLLPGVIGYIYFTYFTGIPEVVVPDLTGKRLNTALMELNSLKLEGRKAGSVFDLRYAEGRVVSQQPEIGRMVKVGRTINLIVSSGKRKVVVPNLLGRPEVQARAVLAAKGLLLGNIGTEYAVDLEPGIVLAQSPLPGDQVNVNSYVSVTISTSQEPVVEEVTEEAASENEGGFLPWQ